ncbi:DUF4932 domain-containing protein [Alistipes sp.]|uniref:DUF4932 domain-containing protein n=1 Tax=Alistipes sp. TaxID=1872444 RepID=UPI003AB7E9BA
MKRFFLTLLASSLLLTAGAQTLLPVRDSIGKLSISVDPRMELLGMVQLLAGFEYMTSGTPYSDSVKANFAALVNSDAVKYAQKLYETQINEIGYDGFTWRMLIYSYPPELKQVLPCPEFLKEPATIEKKLRRYRRALKRFAKEPCFADFWADNEPYYRQLVDWCKSNVDNVDIVGQLESYCNMKQKSYDIIMNPLFGNLNWGHRLSDPAGGMSVYALLSTPQNLNVKPGNNRFGLQTMLFHEFGHSFVNPFVELYPELMLQSSNRFEPIRRQMFSQGYEEWKNCVIEHIVRAVVIRLIDKVYGPETVEESLWHEEHMGFGYIRPLVAKLREYETLRDSLGISLGDYVPKLLKVLNEAEFHKARPRFEGRINAVWSGRKVVFVYPTEGNAAEVFEYVRLIMGGVGSRIKLQHQWQLVADSVAVKMPLDSCDIICYGTVENNQLLAKYRSKLPFRVEPGAIIADRRYEDPEVRLIACVPNPENPELGMAVYTAIDECRIIDINYVSHGTEDFCIFVDDKHILSRGYFEKRGTEWRFPQSKPSAD